MSNSNVKRNLWYQSLYNVLITILPLITAPYLARHLGVTSQGIYSYTDSIVNYFVLFAMLGIVSYGTKCIAQYKDDKQMCNEKFSSIYLIQFISSFISLMFYILYLLFFVRDNINISTIQMIAIFACFFDINWLFLGFEDFKFVVIRNIVFRLISVISILILVKNPNDLWIYAIIMVSSVLLSNITLWFRIRKYIKFCLPNKEKILKEIRPIILLFIPLLALSIYHIMDKTMLGLLSDYDNVGFYYNADKVINIPIGIIAGISTVLFPRSVVVLKKSKDEFQRLLLKGLEGTIVVSIALSFGIAAISNEFTPFFFGDGFEPCITLIMVLSPVMIIKSISTIIRYQYLIPLNKESIFIYSVLGGAFSNLIFNVLLIPKFGAMGAVIGTLIAEFVACVIQLFLIRDEIKFVAKMLKNVVIYLLIGAIMFIVVRVIAFVLNVTLSIKLIVEILFGGFVYIILMFIYFKINKNALVDFNEIIRKIRRK